MPMTDLEIEELFHHDPFCYTEIERDRVLLPILKRQIISSLQNPYIYSFYHKLQINPELISSPEHVPAVPVTMFKWFNLATRPDQEIMKTLRSSGTTNQVPSIIPLDKQTMHNQTRALSSILSSFMGKQRRVFLVIDHEGINSPIHAFTARTAGVRGLSLYAKKVLYLLKEEDGILTLNTEALDTLRAMDPETPLYAFGFTYIIWSVFVQKMLQSGSIFSFHNLLLFHSGGWKKLKDQEVSKEFFSENLAEIFGTIPSQIIDFYGMAEQTGIIFPDCQFGNKHVPIFSKVIIRDIQTLRPCNPGETGLIEVMSVLPQSYYGQAVLTEDIGSVEGLDGCPCGRRGIYFRIKNRVELAEIRGCGDTFRMRS